MGQPLDKIESTLRQLIENSAGLFVPQGIESQLVHRLVQTVQANCSPAEESGWVAPSAYTIILNPNHTTAWQTSAHDLEDLAHSLEESLLPAGIRFTRPPVLRLTLDENMDVDDLQVVVAPVTQEFGHTTSIPAIMAPVAQPDLPAGACLITPDESLFPLRTPVVNIGRRSDNHLIIDDPRVSRTHAQLRLVQGRYVIMDLNSTGGTYVNGERIARFVLRPGDVISLAGIALIYTEDNSEEP